MIGAELFKLRTTRTFYGHSSDRKAKRTGREARLEQFQKLSGRGLARGGPEVQPLQRQSRLLPQSITQLPPGPPLQASHHVASSS